MFQFNSSFFFFFLNSRNIKLDEAHTSLDNLCRLGNSDSEIMTSHSSWLPLSEEFKQQQLLPPLIKSHWAFETGMEWRDDSALFMSVCIPGRSASKV